MGLSRKKRKWSFTDFCLDIFPSFRNLFSAYVAWSSILNISTSDNLFQESSAFGEAPLELKASNFKIVLSKSIFQ